MTQTEAHTILEETAAKLGEHFDAVQLLVTWNEESITFSAKRGSGNWYARQGLAHEFITEDQAQTQAREIAQAMPQPPEEPEEV